MVTRHPQQRNKFWLCLKRFTSGFKGAGIQTPHEGDEQDKGVFKRNHELWVYLRPSAKGRKLGKVNIQGIETMYDGGDADENIGL